MIEPDKIIRSKRKTLSVSVDVFGNVVVRAPLRLSEERIFAFLKEKERWITAKKSAAKAKNIALPSENLDGFALLLLGKEVKIQLYSGKKALFFESAGAVFLPKTGSKEALIALFKALLKEILAQKVPEIAQKEGYFYKSVQVTSARTCWGSCSGNNALHFSYRLIFAPEEVIDYVVCHELCHTVHKDHSARFWAAVERAVPDFKQKRAWLKEHAYLMRIL